MAAAPRRATAAVLLAILAAHVALMAVRYVETRSFVAGDSAWQFATMRSVYMQGSLDLRDEAAFFHEDRSPRSGNRRLLRIPDANPTTGLVTSVYPVGAPLIRLPAYAAADVLARAATRLGLAVDRTGYRGVYQVLPAVYSLAFAVGGMLLLARALGRAAGAPRRALAATCVVWLASPVVYYLTIEPLMSHAIAVGLASGLVALALDMRVHAAPSRFALLGLMCGALAVTRYQDAAYVLVPLVLALASTSRAPALVALAAGAAPPVALQLAVNAVWYGSPWTVGYGALVEPRWTAPGLWRQLFQPVQGIFTTHPVQLLGLVGLMWFSRVDRRLALALAAVFLVQLYAVAAMIPTTPGISFGNRTITSLAPAFILGWYSLSERFPRLDLAAVILVCANGVLLVLYSLRVIPDPSAL